MKTRRIPGITKEDASTSPVAQPTPAELFHAEMQKFIDCMDGRTNRAKSDLQTGLDEYKARYIAPVTETEQLVRCVNQALSCEDCRHFVRDTTQFVDRWRPRNIECELRGRVSNRRCSSFIRENVVDYSAGPRAS